MFVEALEILVPVTSKRIQILTTWIIQMEMNEVWIDVDTKEGRISGLSWSGVKGVLKRGGIRGGTKRGGNRARVGIGCIDNHFTTTRMEALPSPPPPPPPPSPPVEEEGGGGGRCFSQYLTGTSQRRECSGSEFVRQFTTTALTISTTTTTTTTIN
ncbi:hypothetical protein M0802_009535 [Mischocyttarus mexicanus]|nr:hypothetical protein M0802_009535 [Mischocyttarus mexicanus]